jgi:pimeloyl-ACP methyl ester carboxylesterase
VTQRCRVSIRNGKREVSHLAVRIDQPEIELEDPLAILYLHGFGSSQSGEKASFFRQQAIRHGVTFCSFDFQGHGESGGEIVDLTMTRDLEDVRRVHDVLRARGHRRVVVMGSSMGGLVGLWYSALNPAELVAGLHVAPALSLEEGLARWAGEEGLLDWQRKGKIKVENELGTWDLNWIFMDDLLEYHDEKLMELYRTPCLLLQGQQDDRVDWARVQEFAAQCAYRDIEFHLYADGDHRLADRKERLWALMVTFLRGRGLLNSHSF